MFHSRTVIPELTSTPAVVDTSERRRGVGVVLRKAPFRSGFDGSTHTQVAVLTRIPDSQREEIKYLSASSTNGDFHLCRKGDKVNITFYRRNPASAWIGEVLQIDWDIDREKAALGLTTAV